MSIRPGWKSSETHVSAGSGGLLAWIACEHSNPTAVRIVAIIGLSVVAVSHAMARTVAKMGSGPFGLIISALWTWAKSRLSKPTSPSTGQKSEHS